MNPRATAYTVTATIAAIVTLAVFGVGMFLIATVFAALVWVAVVIEQRDDARQAAETARDDRKAKLLAINRQLSLLTENLALKARLAEVEADYARLDQDNMRMAARLAELELTTDVTVQVPRLRVVASVPAQTNTDDAFWDRLYGSDYEWPGGVS